MVNRWGVLVVLCFLFSVPVVVYGASPAQKLKAGGSGGAACYDSTGAAIPCPNGGQAEVAQKQDAGDQRFRDNGNGTVFDTLTGLIWTKDANSPGPPMCNPGVTKTWRGALDYVDCLNTNLYLGFSDWRLSDLSDLSTIVTPGQVSPVAWLTNHGFVNVQTGFYWTATAGSLSLSASAVNTAYGFSYTFVKTANNYNAWPLRGKK